MAFLTAALTVLTLLAGPGGDAAAQHPDEYQVKAAFLFNFAKFVDWPAGAFAGADGPFTICVLGNDSFRETLGNTVAGKTVGGHPVAIIPFSEGNQIGACRMLFVESPGDKHTLSVLNGAGLRSPGMRHGILTVGDGEGAAGEVIIRFLMENGKVRFEIDAAAAERAGIHISAKLLSLAQTRKK
ncbi:MAG TPA: YfiR family protein [Bryobacteraceae bacterium]|nr:YfiR family protein [Bryobacteraceae bacterium]